MLPPFLNILSLLYVKLRLISIENLPGNNYLQQVQAHLTDY